MGGISQDLSFDCHRVPPLASVVDEADARAEQAFCSIDFSSASVAICPKTWSTSPGALVYDLKGTTWAGRAQDFERETCADGRKSLREAGAELAIFKNSLNGRETSGTFAPSSLLYYHFSRLLQTRLQVPVAVFAEFPVTPYLQRVVEPGLKASESPRLKMLQAGWREMHLALSDPAAFHHRRELFTDDNARLWGMLLLEDGRRYGPEVNGTRASGWGDGQNRDFQRTPAFIALRTDQPLADAVDAGLKEAAEDPEMGKALSRAPSAAQVAWWMHEITELVILDTLFRQQDRIGNIDYRWRWQWLEQGELHTSYTDPGREDALKLRVSELNDNDAGVRSGYANYASRTGMLEGWHHLDPGLYSRVQALGADFATGGRVAQAVRANYRLSRREAEGVIERGIQVAETLRQRCEHGALRFDLGVANVLNPSAATVAAVPCTLPEEPQPSP
jgi:hypothetical protein